MKNYCKYKQTKWCGWNLADMLVNFETGE